MPATPPANAPGEHRPHLDGLRAVAVYLVVGFHAGLGPLAGGFVGVDLFFVLSGYLVTAVLLRDARERGRVRMVRFYARRVRRLLPAASVTLLVTAAAYAVVASPAQVDAAAGGFRAAALYVSNWHFVAESTDYFASDIDGSPVLHFWSLSVEEQYYLAWPLVFGLLWALARRRQRRSTAILGAAVAAGALASLAWALVRRHDAASHAYFGTDTRAYQLLGGALLAVVITSPKVRASRPLRRAVDLAGPTGLAAVLVASTSLLDLDPVARGVLAAAGSLAVLAGLELGRSTALTALLSLRPVTWLGRVSYGTYLWHWPVVVVLRERGTELRPLLLAPVVAVVATAVAGLSHRYLEEPIRSSAVLDRRSGPVVVAGVVVTLTVGLGLLPLLTSGRGDAAAAVVGLGALAAAGVLAVRGRGRGGPARGRSQGVRLAAASMACAAAVAGLVVTAPEPVVAPAVAVDWRAAREDEPRPVKCTAEDLDACVVADGDGPTVMMIGDSHAAMFAPMLAAAAEELGVRGVRAAHGACPWFDGVVLAIWGDQCLAAKADWYGEVLAHFDPDVVLLVQRRLDDPLAPRILDWRGHGAIHGPDPAFADFVTERTRATIDLLDDGRRRFVVVEGVPTPADDDPPIECLSRGAPPEDCAYQASPVGPEELAFRALADADPNDRIWSMDIDDLACPALPTCDAVVDGMVRMSDGSHLTTTFARSLGPAFAERLVELGVLDGL